MKIVLKLMLVVSGLVLVGCGGGGGGSSSTTSLVYEGKTEPANLNLQDVKAFMRDIDIPHGDVVSLADNTNNKITSKPMTGTQNFKVVKGDVGGTVDVEEENIDDLTTKKTMTFANFNDGEETFQGKIIFITTYNKNFNTEINWTAGGVLPGEIKDFYVTKLDIRFENLNVKDNESDISMQGSLVKESEVEGKSILTQNLIVKNNINRQMIKLENFKIVLDQYERELSYDGRIYDSENGYIDVSTLHELAYDAQGNPAVGGIVRYEGKETIAYEKMAYDNGIRVEIDNGKDGTIDTVEVYNAETLEVIPNRKPVIDITFPESIYTDTNMSAVQVNVYDPDLDGFTTEYEWTVNDEVKGSSIVLDNTLFKKHDTLKLTVTATDDRVGDVKSSIEEKEDDVLNSRPVIESSFVSLALNIGDQVTLNYSVTDADDDPISILWEHYATTSSGVEAYYHPIDDCSIAIEEYDREHRPFFAELNPDRQEDLLQEWCPTQMHGSLVNFNFVEDKLFEAVAPGIYLHKMIVSDGEANKTKVFDSNISKMDIVDRQVNNHDQYTYNTAYNIYMKDFDNDGNKDLIYMGSVTKHDNGSTMVEPSGEVIVIEPSDYQVPALVVEYRNGDTVLKKETYDINRTEFDDFYVNDVNGDGKLDIVLMHTNGYSPPTNKRFSVMLQNDQDGLNAEINTDLSNYDALAISDITGDGSDDIILNATDGFNDLGIQIFSEDGNKTVTTSLSNTLGHYGVARKILVKDLDNNTKQDIILVNKNFRDENNTLTFVCSVMSQDKDGNFTEKTYEKVLAENLDEYESITDVIISDLADMKNVFIVTTTKHIFLLKIHNDMISVLKKLDYLNSKSKLSTNILTPVDVNNDGKKDLIVIDSSLYSDVFMGIFIQKDNLNFFVEQNYSFEEGYSSFNNPSYTLGDINNDGKQEIFFSTGDELYFK